METIATFFKRISTFEYRAAYSNQKDFEKHRADDEFICKECSKDRGVTIIVDVEGKLTAQGIIEICPFCRTEICV